MSSIKPVSAALLAATALLLPAGVYGQDWNTVYRTQFTEAKLSAKQLKVVEDAFIDFTVARTIGDRIVGGVPVSAGELPWMATIFIEDSSGNLVQLCGGTLISKNKVVTAAHCNILPARAYRIAVGKLNIAPPVAGLIRVEKFTSHPGYVAAPQGNDVAVITLSQEASPPFAALSTEDPPETEFVMGLIAGWGAISENGPSSTILLKASVPFVAGDDCKKSYPSLPSGTICAGFKQGGTDTCQGDSGGPLLRLGLQASLTLSGVTSYGTGCARQGYYGVYTRVSAHHSWIVAQ